MKQRPRKEGVPTEISEYMAELGRRSRGGGRPRIPDKDLTPEQRKRRERYENSKKEKAD